MKTDILSLESEVKRFCEERDWDQFHSPKELAIGLSTEANELLDLFRFKTDQQMETMMKDAGKRERISEEISDVFFFLLRFAQMYGFDLADGLSDKIKKNGEKYPAEKVRGSNKKYDEYE